MLSPEQREALFTTQLFKYLESFEIDLFLKHSQLLTFVNKEPILSQGKKSPGLYIIITGKVLITAKVLGEGIINIEILNAGSMIGELNLSENRPAPTTAIAETSVQCLLIGTSFFKMLAEFFPETKYKIDKFILEQTLERLHNVYQKLIHTMTQTNMIERSVFSEVIRTLNRPSESSFEASGIELSELEKKHMFSLFNHEEFELLIKNTMLLKTTGKCTLIQENYKNFACYFILRGAVQSSIIFNNMVAKLSVLGPYMFFSCVSVICPEKESFFNYSTHDRAIILKLSAKNLDLIKSSRIQLWYKLYDLISRSFVILEKCSVELNIRLNIESYNR